jgi:hypothetical protein
MFIEKPQRDAPEIFNLKSRFIPFRVDGWESMTDFPRFPQ